MKKDKLVIVESAAKAKTIQKYLGKEFVVRFCLGHVRDLPKTRFGVDIENNFQPKYVIISHRRKVVNQLKKEAKNKKSIYLASDPDREGEAISWHLANILGNGCDVYRVRFYEITSSAIKAAFSNPDDINYNLVNAQQARRVLDRILGYKLSPLLWKKVGRGLSAGRVQSVALRLIVEREREIKEFVPQEYWELIAELSKSCEHKIFKAKLIKIGGRKAEIKDSQTAHSLVAKLREQKFIVEKVDERESKQNPPSPFKTSTLQQEAFNKFKFPASRTMRLAQDLYEGMDIGDEGRVGLITYMRTDSLRLAPSAVDEIREFIHKNYGQEYLPLRPNIYKSRGHAQEAHEAIRPTSIFRTPDKIRDYLSPEHFKLYELIWKRTLASQMVAMRYIQKTVDVKVDDCLFRAVGRRMLFPGFTVIYDKEDMEDLPLLQVGEELNLIDIEAKQHFTKPPPRYTDASLVRTMEEKGIGRPSTYAPTIQTLLKREYIRRREGRFYPTELGTVVSELLVDYFPKIMDLGFTAEIEEELDKVEEGELDWRDVVRQFYQPFIEQLESAYSRMREVKKEEEETGETCPECGRKLVIKWSRRGRFISCSGYPECKYAKSITTGIKCPQPGCDGELVERKSKKGKIFYGCSRYPECNFTTSKLPKDG
ncbi:MAG: type I DNA topoisomerase [Candidatus Omnitrophota bacterium]|nr:MAG: type I DNA topoisomerase [Candidatus Omnitrophota bacterium]